MTNTQQQTADWNYLKAAPRRMSNLAAHYRAQARALQGERRYLMPAEFDRRMATLKREQQQQIAQIRTQCEQARDRLQAAADYARGAAGRHEDTARVLLTQQAWQRILPVLARQQGLPQMLARAQQMIAEASRTGDLATLRAFRENLPWWLEANEPDDMRARREAAGKSFADGGNDSALYGIVRDTETALLLHGEVEDRAAIAIPRGLAPYGQAISANLERLGLMLDDPEGPTAQVGMADWTGEYIQPGEVTPEMGTPFAYRKPSFE